MTLQPDPFATPPSDAANTVSAPASGFPPAPGFPGAGNVYVEQPTGLALWAKILVAVVTFVTVLLAATSGQFEATARAAAEGELVFNAHRILSSLLFLPQLASFVILALWMQNVRKNMDLLRNSSHRLHRSFAWWGWIIPFASFALPLLYMRDLARKGHTGLLTLWWGGWVVGNLASATASLSVSPIDASVNESLIGYYPSFYALSAAGIVASAAGLIMLITKITAEHTAPAGGAASLNVT